MKFRHILRVILLMAAFCFAAFSALPASAATHTKPMLLHLTGAIFDDETMAADPAADPATDMTTDPAADPAEPADPPAPDSGGY